MGKKPTPRAIRGALDAMEVPEVYREPVAPRPVGRPRIHPPATDDDAVSFLCRKIACGLSLHDACQFSEAPSEFAVYERLAEDEDFQSRIARAREVQQDYHGDQLIRIADEATPEDWQVKKLQIWTRQWNMSRLAPRKYGERRENTQNINVTLSGLIDEARGSVVTIEGTSERDP